MKKRRKQKSGLPEYAKRIEHERAQFGLTQKELGEILDVGQNVISSWETGAYPPSSESFAALGNLFHSSALWFYEQAGIDRESFLAAAADELMYPGPRLRARIGWRLALTVRAALAKAINAKITARELKRGWPKTFFGRQEVGVETAVRFLGLPKERIQRLAKCGALRARRIMPQGGYIYDLDSVSDYKAKLAQRERETRGGKAGR